MLIRGRLLGPEDRGHVVITVTGDRVEAIDAVAADAPAPDGALGGSDATITPGLIDIQVNGALGHDLSDPTADVTAVSRGLATFGVTAYLATFVTSPLERYGPTLLNLASAATTSDVGARLLGIHLEGPFLSPNQAGTHTKRWLQQPSSELAELWLDQGPVRLMTLAPELPGALDMVRMLASRGVAVALGHTDATWAEAEAAAAAGARMGTHLFNAMRRLHHREPGVVGFLLASTELAVSIIADGHHVDPRLVALVARLKGPDRFIVVSDALAGLGMPLGRFRLAGVETVSDGVVGRRTDGTLSGSLLPLNGALGNLVAWRIPADDAVRAVTANPARILGLEASMGRVAVGRTADLAVFDADWAVAATVVGGAVVHGGPGR